MGLRPNTVHGPFESGPKGQRAYGQILYNSPPLIRSLCSVKESMTYVILLVIPQGCEPSVIN